MIKTTLTSVLEGDYYITCCGLKPHAPISVDKASIRKISGKTYLTLFNSKRSALLSLVGCVDEDRVRLLALTGQHKLIDNLELLRLKAKPLPEGAKLIPFDNASSVIEKCIGLEITDLQSALRSTVYRTSKHATLTSLCVTR